MPHGAVRLAGGRSLDHVIIGSWHVAATFRELADLRRSERMDGRGDWIRTSDLHTPSVMRYQAALRPDLAGGI